MHGEVLLCIVDVDIFVLCGFGVWRLPYLTLRRRTLIHCRVPNPSSNNQYLTTQLPTLSMWIRLMPQGLPMEAPQHQFPSQPMQLLPNTAIVPERILTIALRFLLAKQMRVTYVDNAQMFSF